MIRPSLFIVSLSLILTSCGALKDSANARYQREFNNDGAYYSLKDHKSEVALSKKEAKANKEKPKKVLVPEGSGADYNEYTPNPNAGYSQGYRNSPDYSNSQNGQVQNQTNPNAGFSNQNLYNAQNNFNFRPQMSFGWNPYSGFGMGIGFSYSNFNTNFYSNRFNSGGYWVFDPMWGYTYINPYNFGFRPFYSTPYFGFGGGFGGFNSPFNSPFHSPFYSPFYDPYCYSPWMVNSFYNPYYFNGFNSYYNPYGFGNSGWGWSNNNTPSTTRYSYGPRSGGAAGAPSSRPVNRQPSGSNVQPLAPNQGNPNAGNTPSRNDNTPAVRPSTGSSGTQPSTGGSGSSGSGRRGSGSQPSYNPPSGGGGGGGVRPAPSGGGGGSRGGGGGGSSPRGGGSGRPR